MLPFFFSHPSEELPLSPPHHCRRKTIKSISILMKRGSHTGCDCRPVVTALGCCQGLRRDKLQLLQLRLVLAWSDGGDRAVIHSRTWYLQTGHSPRPRSGLLCDKMIPGMHTSH